MTINSPSTFTSIPLNSLLLIQPKNRLQYLESLFDLPKNARKMLLSPQTGAFLKGLLSVYDVSPEMTPRLAFIVLNVSLGRRPLSDLPVLISSKLSLPHDKSVKIATELEKELFTNIKEELQIHWSTQQKTASATKAARHVQQQETTNTLNLKQSPKSPPVS